MQQHYLIKDHFNKVELKENYGTRWLTKNVVSIIQSFPQDYDTESAENLKNCKPPR